ncbi:MAG: response regulator, partial [Bacteroidales bacterium]|nr:response regulator [Bacteroidales bacterium]
MDTILLVDDDKYLQQTLSIILEDEGFEVFSATNGKKAIKEIQNRMPDIVLLDMKLPDMDGMMIQKKLKKIFPEYGGSIIILTAYGDINGAITSMKLGAFDYITKPFDNEELILTIQKAIKSQQLSKEVKILREKLKDKIATE